MAIDWNNLFDQFGAELKALRGIEAAYEWYTRVDGSTYFKDFLNAEYSNAVAIEEATEQASKANFVDSIAPALQGAHAARQSAFETYFFALLDLVLNTATADQSDAIVYEYDQELLALGEVRISNRAGRFGVMRERMVTDAQTIRQNVVAAGALTADSGNQGVLSASGLAGADHTLAGDVNLVVTDETVGAVRLSCELRLTNALVDGTSNISADNELTVGKFFQDGQTGFQGTLDLGPVVESGDDGAMFSAITITNPSGSDSAMGKYYITVLRVGTGAGTIWRISLYRSGSLLSTDLVTQVDVTGIVGTAAVSLVGAVSTVAATFDKAAANVHLPLDGDEDTDILFDIKTPRLGDRWTVAMTNDESGVIATKIARRWRVSLNSVANPGQTIADSKAASVPMT